MGNVFWCRYTHISHSLKIKLINVHINNHLKNCSLLSRSNNQTGRGISGAPRSSLADQAAKLRQIPGSPQQSCFGVASVRLDHRADPVVGQDLKQQGVFDASINDVHTLDAIAGSVQCRADFRQHATGKGAVGNHVIDLFRGDAGDQLPFLVEDARRIGEQHQFFRL